MPDAEQLKIKYRRLPNTELLYILAAEPGEYTSDAVEAAIDVLRERGHEYYLNDIRAIQEQIAIDKLSWEYDPPTELGVGQYKYMPAGKSILLALLFLLVAVGILWLGRLST